MSDLFARSCKSDLLRPPTGVYLNTAAEGLLLAGAGQALAAYAAAKAAGEPGRAEMVATEGACRAEAAEWLGAAPAEIAFTYNTSTAVQLVAHGLTWQPGDRVLVCSVEYPSNVLPWQQLAERGVATDVLPTANGNVEPAAIAAALTPRTRLVAISLVSFMTGARADLAALHAITQAHGALLMVDAIQGFGAVPLRAADADLIVSGTYKWILGMHGLSLLYAHPSLHERLQPPSAGWRSTADAFGAERFAGYRFKPGMQRFEPGMPGFAGMYVMLDAMRTLRGYGREWVWARVAALSDRLHRGLTDLGAQVITPAQPERRAGIVSFRTAAAGELVAALAQRDIFVYQTMPGIVRVSPHFYNDPDDIDRFLDALESLWAEHPHWREASP